MRNRGLGLTLHLEKEVSIDQWSPNRIEMTAEGPGKLVLSELVYPGWVASVDGEAVHIEEFDTILRAVSLDAGSHHIIFAFRPGSVYIGIGLFFVGVASLGFGSLRERRGM